MDKMSKGNNSESFKYQESTLLSAKVVCLCKTVVKSYLKHAVQFFMKAKLYIIRRTQKRSKMLPLEFGLNSFFWIFFSFLRIYLQYDQTGLMRLRR